MKTKFNILVISCWLIFSQGLSQSITLSFSGKNNGQAVHLEKIKIENLDKACDTTLFYPDSSIILHVSGIDNPVGIPDGLIIFQNSPNPVSEMTSVKIFNPVSDNISVVVWDASGKKVCSYSNKLERGYHYFDFYPGNSGSFILSFSTSLSTQSIKVTSSVLKVNGISSIRYSRKCSKENFTKESMSQEFDFSVGDQLRYTGYYYTMTKVLDDIPQNNKSYTFIFDNSGFICGQSLTINHNIFIYKTTVYGTVPNIPGEPGKCWITSNLGADRQASTVNDSTETAAGWYWQFNLRSTYRHDGITREPNSMWINRIIDNSDWLSENDPCLNMLGSGWRMPTYTEWSNVFDAGGWLNWNDPWSSGLKLHAAGYLKANDGDLKGRGIYGFYWSSTQANPSNGWFLEFYSINCNIYNINKAVAYSIRCLRED